MKLVIMQPYFFPYLGYFQLLHAADRFVFYDDVNYIKNGWINRNRLLLRGQPHFFTVPLQGASPFAPIRETRFDAEDSRWRRKMIGTFQLAYKGAPYRAQGMQLVESVLQSANGSIADLARDSVVAVMRHLGLERSVQPSSIAYGNAHLRGEERVLDICRREGASMYINAPGGRGLYHRRAFDAQAVELRFLAGRLPAYEQDGPQFVAGLSIVDIVMRCSVARIGDMLADYALEEAAAEASSTSGASSR